MAERGTYRSVKTVLLDGPDFQQLPPCARWVFMALKLSFGPSGIEVHYPEALVHELAGKTGHSPDEVRSALNTLSERGWIRTERNVVWIQGQLHHDPGISPKDQKHRKSIQGHVSGLPRLAIVRRFIGEHPDFFPDDEGDFLSGLPVPNKGHGRGTEGASKGVATTEDRRGKTEEGRPKTENNTHPPPANAEKIADVENSPTDRLTEWLGEHAHVLDGTPLDTAKARSALHDQFVGGLWPGVWKHPEKGTSVEPEKRPRLMAAALSGYFGAEGKRELVMGEFAGMLRRLVRDEAASLKNGTGSDAPDPASMTDPQHARYIEIRQELESGGMDAEDAARKAAKQATEEVPA